MLMKKKRRRALSAAKKERNEFVHSILRKTS